MRDDRAFIEDMLDRIRLVEEFTAEGRAAFFSSRMMQEAVIRALEIIGEASHKVTPETQAANPHIPWRQMNAFRNFVVHAYWNIKLERIWEIVENDLPLLKPQLEAIRDALPDEPTEE